MLASRIESHRCRRSGNPYTSALLAASLLAALACFGACRRQPAPITAQAIESSTERSAQLAAALGDPATATMSLPSETALPPALPLFADDSQHPWNHLHHALFANLVTVKQAACLVSRSCDVLPTPVGFFEETTAVQAEYADTPTQLMLPGLDYLLTADRHIAAVRALQAVWVPETLAGEFQKFWPVG